MRIEKDDLIYKGVAFFVNLAVSTISCVMNARLKTSWDYFRFGLTVITAMMPFIGLILVKYFIKDSGTKFKAVNLAVLTTFFSWLCSLICAAKVAFVPAIIIAANLITFPAVFRVLAKENARFSHPPLIFS